MEAKRDMMKKVPVREQDPKVRATNFKEVCLGYNMEEAVAESERCLNCKNDRAQMIFLIVGLMLGSLYSVVLGPTTLEPPRAAMALGTFRPLFFLLGGAVILGLQGMKIWLTRKGIQKTEE